MGKTKKVKAEEPVSEKIIFASDTEDFKNSMLINFDKIFDKKIDPSYCAFNLSKKRTYCNIKSMIIDSINEFFNLDMEKNESAIIIRYFKLKMQIEYLFNQKTLYPFESFIDDLKRFIIQEDFTSLISDYINQVYIPMLDDKDEVKAKKDIIKPGLQFTDEHAKILSKIVLSMRIIIPLLSHYIYYWQKELDKLTEELLLSGLELVMDCYDDVVDMNQKIFKLVESRVISTRYSDRKIWYYLQNLGIDPNIYTDGLYRKVLVDILPKLMINKSPVSYLHTVIKQQIDFQFRFNFPINYKPIDMKKTDSEGLSEFDKMEINAAKTNEAKTVLIKVAIPDTIKNIMKKFKVSISKDEMEFYRKNLKRNKFQMNIVFLFFSKFFNSYNDLYNCNVNQYFTLCVLCKKILRDHYGLEKFAEYITASVSNYQEKKIFDKKLIEKVTNTPDYDFLVQQKYDNTSINLLDSNLILKNIATININKFLKVDYEDQENLNEEIINNPMEQVYLELLKFLVIV